MFFRWHMIIIMISIRKANINMTLVWPQRGRDGERG